MYQLDVISHHYASTQSAHALQQRQLLAVHPQQLFSAAKMFFRVTFQRVIHFIYGCMNRSHVGLDILPGPVATVAATPAQSHQQARRGLPGTPAQAYGGYQMTLAQKTISGEAITCVELESLSAI